MRLFKSDWMFEPAPGTFDAPRPRFAFGYGTGRRVPVRTVCPPLAALDELPSPAVIEHERAVLRRLAEYDRAA